VNALDPDTAAVLPVDDRAVTLVYVSHEPAGTWGYDDAGELVEVPDWRVHCARVLKGSGELELWSIVVPVEPPPLAYGQVVTATSLRARYWAARTTYGWTLHAQAVIPAHAPASASSSTGARS
jgi:hypothetical protein